MPRRQTTLKDSLALDMWVVDADDDFLGGMVFA